MCDMSTHGGVVERVIRKTLVPVWLLTGAIVVSAFFFPDVVGTVVAESHWLIVSLLFFGSGLSYLALVPLDTVQTTSSAGRRETPYLLRVRHLGWIRTVRDLTERVRGFFLRQDPITFGVSVVAFVLFFSAYLAVPAWTQGIISTGERVLFHEFGVLFLGAVFISVVYCLLLLVGPWGEIRLGGPDAEPTYTLPTTFALFFTAGIAAGIVFWGPAESIFHYQTPPPFLNAEPQSDAVVVGALAYALFHYGFSAWSAYLAVGIPIAYFTYQRGAPLRVSTILTPFLGIENLDSVPAKLVDVLAIFATIGGVGTSIALVGQQFLTGINFKWGVSYGDTGPLLFVAGLTIIYVISAGSGVQRGIRRIAGVTVVLFFLFAVLLIGVGPRSFIFERGTAAVTTYVSEFVPMSLYTGNGWVTSDWVAGWTVWNWSWWFSWAPFASLFLAAISRGRRIRTVVLMGGVATAGASIVWFLLLGGTALSLQHSGTADILAAISDRGGSEAVAGFPVFEALGLSRLLMFLFLALVIVFIVTSADTSTLIVSILATKRGLAPTTGSIVFWGVIQGAVALSVLLVGGGDALQTIAVLTGGPFAVLSLVALAGLTLAFRRDEMGYPTLVEKVRSALSNRGIGWPKEE